MAIKKIFTKIILVFFALSFLLPLSLFTTLRPARATAEYQCFTDNNGIGKAVNANLIRIDSCSELYVFDPTRTVSNHTPTFVSANNNDNGDKPHGSYQLRLVNCGGSLGMAGYDPNGSPLANAQGESCRKVEDTENFKNAASGAPADLCSMIKNTDCNIWDGKTSLGSNGSQEAIDGNNPPGDFLILNKGTHLPGPICNANNCNDFIANVNNLPKGTAAGQNCGSQGGALSFLFCPILESISGAITWLLGGSAGTQATDTNGGLLVDLLKIPPLDPNTDSGKVVLQVVNNMITFANTFYILLFVIIIFATVVPIGVDNYTIKKTLPKLIVAIILTQFSFLICSIAVDIGNLLGFGVPNLLFQAVQGVPNFANNGSQVGGIPTALIAAIPMASGFAGFLPLFATVGIIVIVVLFIVVFIGILTAFFWLMARYLIVYFLIFLTPLAFAAMVLPGTQKYFKMWAEDSVKVLLTFPIVTGMLAGSLVISQILTNVLNAQSKPGEVGFGIKEIMVGLIPVIALLAVPKALKWSGKLSSAVGGAIGGYIGAKAGSAKSTVSGAAKAGGKTAWSTAKPELATRFGRSNSAAVRGFGRALAGKENLIPGSRGEANWERFRGQQIEQYRKDAALRFAPMDLGAVGNELDTTLRQLAVRPNDERLLGQAQAGMARLAQLGSGGLRRIAQAQNVYSQAVQANGGAALAAANIPDATTAWRGLVGDAGIYETVDSKAPELMDVSGDQAIGQPAYLPNFNEVTINGANYQVRDVDVDLRNKGATELGQLKAGTVATIANQSAPVFERQATRMNWQAAANMASTPQLHPKDAAAIDIWRQVAQRGVTHWEAVGNQAAAAGNQAAFDEAVRNQAYAQQILDNM